MNYLKIIPFFKTKASMKILIFIFFCLILLSGCARELYNISILDSFVLSDIENYDDYNNIEKLYDYIQIEYGNYLADHDLVRIQGELNSTDDGDSVLEFIQFAFYKYIDASREGGNVNVIYIEIEFNDTLTIEIKEFSGAGKACDVPGVPILDQPDTFEEIIKMLHDKFVNIKSSKKEFEVWKTFSTTENGDLKVSVYNLD